MMGEMSVAIADINDTAQYMIDGFVPIGASDSMAFMKAMSTLVQIEHFAMAHDVLMSECTQISKMPRRARAVAAGLLMNQIGIQQQMEEEARTHTAAVDRGEHIIGHTDATDAHTTIRGGAPRMPHMTADGGGAATYDTQGADATNTQWTDATKASPQQPPLAQGHQGDGTTTAGAGTHQRAHFGDIQFDNDPRRSPGGETMATLYASATAATKNLQQRQTDARTTAHIRATPASSRRSGSDGNTGSDGTATSRHLGGSTQRPAQQRAYVTTADTSDHFLRTRHASTNFGAETGRTGSTTTTPTSMRKERRGARSSAGRTLASSNGTAGGRDTTTTSAPSRTTAPGGTANDDRNNNITTEQGTSSTVGRTTGTSTIHPTDHGRSCPRERNPAEANIGYTLVVLEFQLSAAAACIGSNNLRATVQWNTSKQYLRSDQIRAGMFPLTPAQLVPNKNRDGGRKGDESSPES